MTELFYNNRILRRVPGLTHYYETIERLDNERLAAISAFEPFVGGLERDAADDLRSQRDLLAAENARLSQKFAELSAALEAAATETAAKASELSAAKHDNGALLTEISRLSEDRDAVLSRLELCESDCTVLRTDLSRIAHERDTLQSAHAHNIVLQECLSGVENTQETFKAIRQRIDGFEENALRAIANVSAGTVSLASRQEEAIARLGRSLRTGKESMDGQAIDLYLDLLESSLTGVLHKDGEKAPWITTDEFNPSIRSIGRDWPRNALTMIGTARMRNLRMLLRQAIDDKVVGDFVEAGVWRGGACIYAKGILRVCGEEERKVFVADSFRGLPDPNPHLYPADQGDIHSTFAELAISLDVVKENFSRYGLLDENVVFLEGWFKDTLNCAPIESISVLRLDGDMYESTIDTLEALYNKVSKGGFVIIDDYILKPCAQAVDDFRNKNKINAPIQPVDDAAIWWRV